MSLFEVKSIEVIYRRDSFSDRVCDDLSEVILKYLSLEDKLRLECVSKQFQRTALISKTALYLDSRKSKFNNFESLEKLFKKCTNLYKIVVNTLEIPLFQLISNDLFEVILKYCNNLTHIHFKSDLFVRKEVLKQFFQKFGKKLISLKNCSIIIYFYLSAKY